MEQISTVFNKVVYKQVNTKYKRPLYFIVFFWVLIKIWIKSDLQKNV